MKFISVEEYLMGRATFDTLSETIVGNINTIVPRANELLDHFGEYRKVNSGYRTERDQLKINPKAPKSMHTEGAAVDLEDKDGRLKIWCMGNLPILAEIGLWMESPRSTPTWVHIQCKPPKSASRVFNP